MSDRPIRALCFVVGCRWGIMFCIFQAICSGEDRIILSEPAPFAIAVFSVCFALVSVGAAVIVFSAETPKEQK